MRKRLAYALILMVCSLLLVSCAQKQPPVTTNSISEYKQFDTTVLEIGMQRWDYFNEHHDEVPEIIITQDENKIDVQKDIVFLGKTYSTQYLESHYSIIGDLKFDRYQILDHEKNSDTVDVFEDGSIKRIGGKPLFTVDTNENNTVEKVKKALEEIMKDEIDLTLYDHFEYTEEYGYRWFNLYNEDDDIVCDYSTNIYLNDEGDILSCWLGDPQYRFSNVAKGWSIYNFNDAIKRKLDLIVGETSTISEYRIFDQNMQLVMYENEYYFRCDVPLTLVRTGTQNSIGDVWCFLVKVPQQSNS